MTTIFTIHLLLLWANLQTAMSSTAQDQHCILRAPLLQSMSSENERASNLQRNEDQTSGTSSPTSSNQPPYHDRHHPSSAHDEHLDTTTSDEISHPNTSRSSLSLDVASLRQLQQVLSPPPNRRSPPAPTVEAPPLQQPLLATSTSPTDEPSVQPRDGPRVCNFCLVQQPRILDARVQSDIDALRQRLVEEDGTTIDLNLQQWLCDHAKGQFYCESCINSSEAAMVRCPVCRTGRKYIITHDKSQSSSSQQELLPGTTTTTAHDQVDHLLLPPAHPAFHRFHERQFRELDTLCDGIVRCCCPSEPRCPTEGLCCGYGPSPVDITACAGTCLACSTMCGFACWVCSHMGA